MKQQAVNTFSEGINFDLNPLTTPNNVLTDCVNGSFITFNGDELALQNDSGNTTIDYQGTPVQLSPNFYPLGIKEYGGVLYIISGKLPTLAASSINTFSPGVAYSNGAFVKYSSNIAVFPYTFYKHTNATPRAYTELPIETNKYWEVIGSEQDYNNYAGEVEIGSYPSPEASSSKDYVGDNYILSSVETPLKLYKPKIINKELFKTGRYVTFSENTTAAIDSITHYVKTAGNFVKVPSFYKIKLLHQLSNGYVDLTDHVWSKYLSFLALVSNGTTKYHWADTILQTGQPFKYYCSSLYKGLLAMTLEIEDIDTFELESLPAFTLNLTNYDLSLKVTAIPQATSSVTIPYVKIETWIDGVANPIVIQAVTSTLASYTLSVPDTQANKLLSYRVTPVLAYGGTNYAEDTAAITAPPTIESLLPKEYIEKYTIYGTLLISTKLDNITLRKDPENNSGCVDGLKSNYEYYIVNNDGAYIDPSNLEETSTKYVFLTSGQTLTAGNTLSKNYTIDPGTKKPTLTSTVGIDPGLVTMFHNLIVIEDCSGAVDTIGIPLHFNMNLDSDSTITTIQSGVVSVISGITINEATVQVIPDVDVSIEIRKDGFNVVNLPITSYSVAPVDPIEIGFISSVYLERNDGLFRLIWTSVSHMLPVITPPEYLIVTSLHPSPGFSVYLDSDVSGYSTMYFDETGAGIVDHAEIQGGTPIGATTYINITTSDTHVLYDGIIFEKTETL